MADSIKRREACYWPWIIFFVPLGGVVYFFLVKIDDYNLAWIGDDVLNDALSEHERSPRFLKRRNYGRAIQAKGMLKALGRPA